MPKLCFADSETRSLLDVTQVGAYKYANHPSTEALIWAYAFDDEPVRIWSPPWAWGNHYGHKPDPYPEALLDHISSGGYFIAWNAFFDRWIWNAVMVPKYGWPELRIEQVLCAQAQAEGNNLPGQLGAAAEALRVQHKKDPKGKQLINLLSTGTRESWDSIANETAEKMGRFRSYGTGDVDAMRDVWRMCRPLTMVEWREYQASEKVNDRGIGADVEFARAAMNYANAEFDDINGQLAELCGNWIPDQDPQFEVFAPDIRMTVTNHVRKARWLHEQLAPDEELQELVKRPEREEGKPRYSCDRSTREAVLEMISQSEHSELFEEHHYDRIVQFIELIEAGNSAAVRKFTAIVNQEVDGRIRGQYSFNGAGQTGRFSSRGIQIHNIIRAIVEEGNPDRALDAMDDILAGMAPADLTEKYGYPVSRLLARLIRPTLIAAEGNELVWADYDQIEARCLPWLAMSRGAEAVLEVFRSGVDNYKITAGSILRKPPDEVTKDERQAYGKVPTLALGFGGSVGAFTAMGRNYGVSLPPHRVREVVDQWRAANGWCVAFWHELWEAAIAAFNHPGTWYHAGRVKYCFLPQLMYGTLVCALPDGRWLVYPQFKRERVEYEDPDTGERWQKTVTSFVRGFGSGAARVELWYGTLAENITQATAASFLRRAITYLSDICVLHTHDELGVEVKRAHVPTAIERVREAMLFEEDWHKGLPLSVSVEHGPYYTK